MVFILSALGWIRIRGLWNLPDERNWLWGKLGFVLMGGAMLSKSLIQFSVDGQFYVVFPPYCLKWIVSSLMLNSLWPLELQPTGLLYPWDFPGKNTGVGCHFLLQGIFSTQRSDLGLPHCRQTVYHLSCQGSHYLSEWLLSKKINNSTGKDIEKRKPLCTIGGNVNWYNHYRKWGFPGGSEGKESTCDEGDLGSIPGSGSSPEEGHVNPLQYSCLENPMNRGAW